MFDVLFVVVVIWLFSEFRHFSFYFRNFSLTIGLLGELHGRQGRYTMVCSAITLTVRNRSIKGCLLSLLNGRSRFFKVKGTHQASTNLRVVHLVNPFRQRKARLHRNYHYTTWQLSVYFQHDIKIHVSITNMRISRATILHVMRCRFIKITKGTQVYKTRIRFGRSVPRFPTVHPTLPINRVSIMALRDIVGRVTILVLWLHVTVGYSRARCSWYWCFFRNLRVWINDSFYIDGREHCSREILI